MSHNQYSRRPALWTATSVPTARDLALWDQAQHKSLDGVNGGTWTPTNPIVIGGSGVVLSGAGNKIQGGVTTSTGGRFKHGDNDYVQLSPEVNRVEVFNTLDMAQFVGDLGVSVSESPLGIVVPTGVPVVLPIPSRYLHQGASIVSVTVTGRALSQPTVSGPFLIYAQLFSFDASGSVGPTSFAPIAQWIMSHHYSTGLYVVPFGVQNGYYFRCTTAGTTSGSQPVWPTVIGNTVSDGGAVWTCVGYSGINTTGGSAAAYFNGGNPQTLVMSPDQLMTLPVVDTTQYTYALQFAEDTSGVAWNWNSVAISYTSITSMIPE